MVVCVWFPEEELLASSEPVEVNWRGERTFCSEEEREAFFLFLFLREKNYKIRFTKKITAIQIKINLIQILRRNTLGSDPQGLYHVRVHYYYESGTESNKRSRHHFFFFFSFFFLLIFYY